MPKPSPTIFDTNVLVNANRDGQTSPQTEPLCMAYCVIEVVRARAGDRVVVVDGPVGRERESEVLAEYRNNLNGKGAGEGSQFLNWLLTHIADESKVRRVRLSSAEPFVYEEFPAHDDLRHLDKTDRKWLALAAAHKSAHGEDAEVLQASDSKWRAFQKVFDALGISVRFVCNAEPPAPSTPAKSSRRKSKKRQA